MFSPFSVPISLVTLPTAIGLKERHIGRRGRFRRYTPYRDEKRTESFRHHRVILLHIGYTPYRDEKRTERLRNCRYLWFVRRVTLPTAMKSGLKGLQRS